MACAIGDWRLSLMFFDTPLIRSMSDYWRRSIERPRADAPVALDSVFLCLGFASLAHILIGRYHFNEEWTTPRRLGFVISFSIVLAYSALLALDVVGMFTDVGPSVVVLIYNIGIGGILTPIIKMADLFLAHERYRVLRSAEDNMMGVSAELSAINSCWSFVLQCILFLLALPATFITWPFWIILPFYFDMNDSYWKPLRDVIGGHVDVCRFVLNSCSVCILYSSCTFSGSLTTFALTLSLISIAGLVLYHVPAHLRGAHWHDFALDRAPLIAHGTLRIASQKAVGNWLACICPRARQRHRPCAHHSAAISQECTKSHGHSRQCARLSRLARVGGVVCVLRTLFCVG